MGAHSERMAVRTVVVTTRAAVVSHRNAGNEHAARASAARGLDLLDLLEGRAYLRDADAEAALRQGRRDIEAMLAGGLSPVGPGTADEEQPHPPRTGRHSHEAPSEAR